MLIFRKRKNFYLFYLLLEFFGNKAYEYRKTVVEMKSAVKPNKAQTKYHSIITVKKSRRWSGSDTWVFVPSVRDEMAYTETSAFTHEAGKRWPTCAYFQEIFYLSCLICFSLKNVNSEANMLDLYLTISIFFPWELSNYHLIFLKYFLVVSFF